LCCWTISYILYFALQNYFVGQEILRSKISMERFYSKILGTAVVYDDALRPITSIKDIVIDPENGKVIAFVVNLSRKLVISPIDIESWHDSIKVHSEEVIIGGDEILRVQEVMKRGIHIFGSMVVTKTGDYLGKVNDFSIDSNSLGLLKIYAAKDILGLIKYDSRVISYKNIIEILPHKIVVRENLVAVKEKGREVVSMEELPAG